MGNLLAYPPYVEARRRDKLSKRQTRSANNLQGGRKVVLPYNSFSMSTRTPSEVGYSLKMSFCFLNELSVLS